MSQRKTLPTITRSKMHPRVAYIIIPKAMIPDCDRADIFVSESKAIALKFHPEGESKVCRTSRYSATVRITFPIAMVRDMPFGNFDCKSELRGDTLIVQAVQAI